MEMSFLLSDKIIVDSSVSRYLEEVRDFWPHSDLFLWMAMVSAHGLGTAALSAKEPEALPFCAIAYALTGIFGSLLCSVPAVRQSLIAIVG